MGLTEGQKGGSYLHRTGCAIACLGDDDHQGGLGQCDMHFGCQILLSMSPFPIPDSIYDIINLHVLNRECVFQNAIINTVTCWTGQI